VRGDQIQQLPPRHTLYLAPGSTPEKGPAIVAGDVDELESGTLCLDAGPDSTPIVRRRGDLVRTEPLESVPDTSGFLFGRGVTDEQILTARAGSRLAEHDRIVIGRDSLPRGFVEVAAAWIDPDQMMGEVVTLLDPVGREVRIGAFDGDQAAQYLSRFWDATGVGTCAEDVSSRVTRSVGDTHVTVEGDVPRAVVRDIANRLRATDRRTFDAFREQVARQPARALVTPCWQLPEDAVIVENVDDPYRWVIAMPRRTGPAAYGCVGYSANGERAYPQTFVADPTAAVPQAGAYGFEILGGINSGLQLIGGTAPPETQRVVVVRGPGNTREGVLSDARDPSGRRFFGAYLPPPPPASPFTRAVVTAYDGAGREVGRFEGP
jgi:hypothetical protein